MKLRKTFPVFVLLFALASLITTACTALGISANVFAPLRMLSKFLIVTAMAAVGLNADIGKLIRKGGKPILMGLCCWISIACVSLLMQRVLKI